MSIMKIALGKAHEAETVPEGKYQLEVVTCTEKRTKADDRDMVVMLIKINNPPKKIENPAPMQEYFVLPNEEDYLENPQMANDWVRNLRRALEALNVPYAEDGFDPKDAQGATCEVAVTLETDDDGEERNHPRFPKFKE